MSLRQINFLHREQVNNHFGWMSFFFKLRRLREALNTIKCIRLFTFNPISLQVWHARLLGERIFGLISVAWVSLNASQPSRPFLSHCAQFAAASYVLCKNWSRAASGSGS